MQEELLPLFPLSVVLLPRTQLPLHIFEDRYKEMIGEAIRRGSEFGVVLAANEGIVNTGCTAIVEKVVHRYPDGRLDILSIGRRRFEIFLLNQEKEYLQAAVQFFDDEDAEPAPPALRQQALDAYRAAPGAEDLPEPDAADSQFSFQLARGIQDIEFRQQLLMTRSEAQRLQRLVEFLPVHTSRQKHIEHVRLVSQKNGHGQWPPKA